MPPMEKRPWSSSANASTASTSSTREMMASRLPPGGIQAVHARQDKQSVSLHQAGHMHGQDIVVPKLQLLHGYGIIFIDNRDNASVLKQAQHRGLHVAAAEFQILRCQQELGHIHVKVVEKILIRLHQPRLPPRPRTPVSRTVPEDRTEDPGRTRRPLQRRS